MKKLVIVVISILFFNSCGRENLPLMPAQNEDYFPLQLETNGLLKAHKIIVCWYMRLLTQKFLVNMFILNQSEPFQIELKSDSEWN
jgi:hypothetical protein